MSNDIWARLFKTYDVLLNFQKLISQICQYFLLKKYEKLLPCSFSHFFQQKIFSVFGYKVVKHFTSWPLNELVKLTMLWTTGPWTSHLMFCVRQARVIVPDRPSWSGSKYPDRNNPEGTPHWINLNFNIINSILSWFSIDIQRCVSMGTFQTEIDIPDQKTLLCF